MALAVALTDTGDMDLRGGGPFLVSGIQAAKGALFYRFSTFAGTGPEDPGEWAYDYNYGVLWRQAVFGRYFSQDETQALLADVASRTTGVLPVAAYQVQIEIQPEPRRADITIVQLRAGNSVSDVPVVISAPA